MSAINFAALSPVDPYLGQNQLAGAHFAIVLDTAGDANALATEGGAYSTLYITPISLGNIIGVGVNVVGVNSFPVTNDVIVLRLFDSSSANQLQGYECVVYSSGYQQMNSISATGTEIDIGLQRGDQVATDGGYFEFLFNRATGVGTLTYNATLLITSTPDFNFTNLPALGFTLWSSNNAGTGVSQAVFTGDSTPVVVVGGMVAHRRPIGRGPQMKRAPAVFRRQQGAVNLRQVLLQLFSSPGVPYANTTLNFWTCYNEAGGAIDTLTRTTDSNGVVLLSGLSIAAGTWQVRYALPGDVHKSRTSTVPYQ